LPPNNSSTHNKLLLSKHPQKQTQASKKMAAIVAHETPAATESQPPPPPPAAANAPLCGEPLDADGVQAAVGGALAGVMTAQMIFVGEQLVRGRRWLFAFVCV
jgi:hypothetical protein